MLGRGRSKENPWKTNGRGRGKNQKNSNSNSNTPSENAQSKFLQAQAQMQANIKRHITNDYESSSEEEDLETDNILKSVISSYSQKGGQANDLGRTQKYLEDAFNSGAAICLICIGTVKRTDSIWSCIGCFCFFHLLCIQRWAKDNVLHQKQTLDESNTHKVIDFKWPCPKCRQEYADKETPKNYLCFCGKVENPEFHPWNIPHSCGEICGKPLQPLCGHECLLLCHPGPCPSCPKTVSTKCFCGKSAAVPRRCSAKEWSCNKLCMRQLKCGKHTCQQLCHSGECPPCPKQSVQPCKCGYSKQNRPCADPQWQCDKVCEKPLKCGHHNCAQVCHEAPCSPCPLSENRYCPCGKVPYRLPCTEQNTPTCGDTCTRLLECGRHSCCRPCHRDKCGQCLEVVTKQCRCGLHKKELPCAKEFLCETKCKQQKDCRRHPCNRKCCDGNCPSCEKPCGKTLACGNHKCTSVCHRGPCYPCHLTESIKCRCGRTEMVVPCGRKRAARQNPPRCQHPCEIPPNCHHEKREFHRCHFNDCPPCRQICNRTRSSCSHLCSAPCHTAVLVQINKNFKPAGPWENYAPVFELRELPCPDCEIPMPVTCLGEHETMNFPCYRAKPSSCGRACGRSLACGNHTCKIICHIPTIKNSKEDKSGTECESCEKGCERPRPKGCSHSCPDMICHPHSCPPCEKTTRHQCHCGIGHVFIKCSQWTGTENHDDLLSCGNQCPKNFECGHRCRAQCHPGICPNSELCRKRVKLYCPCKRIKREIPCDLIRQKHPDAQIECDDGCKEKKEQEKKAKEEVDLKRKLEEERRNKEEIEKFEKKFLNKRKYRDRRVQKEEENISPYNLKFFVQMGALGALISFFIYWSIFTLTG